MMPLPFVKVTAKAFKRNLADDSDGSDSDSTTTSSSNSSSANSTSTSTSRSTATTNTTSGGSGNGAKKTFELNDLRDLNYTVPLTVHDADDPTPDESSSNESRSTSASGSTTATTTSTSTTSGSTTSGPTTSGTTSTSGSSTTAKGGGGRTGGGGATASSSEFSLDVSLDPNDVIDPRTGRHIFAKTDREVKIRVLPEQVEPPPSPTLFVNPSGKTASIAAQATHAINLGMYTARSSMQGSTIVRSTSHGFKKAKNTALLTLKIGQFVVKTQVIGPVVQKAVQEWKSFNRFRDRQQAERRSKTLDWFEDRVQTMQREEGIERQRVQDQRRAKWRAHLKKKCSQQQRSDFLNETSAEFGRRADVKLATSLEKEKVRNYFLDNNDSWQMQTLTRHVQEDENRQRQQKADAVADKVREGDVSRQAAADEYLAEYDRGEVTTQATLRIMRRSGIIAGVNAPPAEVEETPLETDTYLLLRLKDMPLHIDVVEKKTETGVETNNTAVTTNNGRQLFPPLGKGGVRQNSGSRGSVLPSLVAGEGNEHNQRVDRLKIPGTEPNSSPPEPPENYPNVARTNNTAATPGPPTGPVATEGRKASRTDGSRKRAGGHNRGKKRSSGAFEVDLLRFRGVEEIRGWKLGAHGGESLGTDLANGACPRLSILRLGWCCLGDRGTRAIVRALCGGGGASAAGRTLGELDLRGNAVTAVGLRVLGGALACGGLPALRVLDLGSNSLRDEGGKSVAHRLLAGAGTWRRLARLDLSGNGMGDGGVEAVFKAVTAPGARLAPDVEMISVRNNYMSPAGRQRLSSPPSFLVV